MNATIANLINSISLIVIGLWGYFDVLSPTALIPVSIGVFLIFCSSGVKNQNKIISHIAVLLTLLILIALVGMRLSKSIDEGGVVLLRLIIMIMTSILSMIFFIRSFIAARKNK